MKYEILYYFCVRLIWNDNMCNTIKTFSFIDSVLTFHSKSIQIVIKICQDMLLSLQKYLIILLNSNKKIWIMFVPRAIKFEFRQHKNYISSKKWIMRCRQNSLASFENIFIMSSKSDWCYLAPKEKWLYIENQKCDSSSENNLVGWFW